jgi:hypothetical protein
LNESAIPKKTAKNSTPPLVNNLFIPNLAFES